MKNLAVIPLRSKSVRVKNKNIKLIAQQPLFFYQLQYARQSGCVNKIVVATDSYEYAGLASAMGADVVMRSEAISGPDSKTEDTLLYVIAELERQGEIFDHVITLQATSPLNSAQHIREGFQILETQDVQSVVTYYEDRRFFLDDPDLLERPMTQNKKPREAEAGCFWITNIAALKEHGNRIVAPFGKVRVSAQEALDIDDEEDLQIVEALLDRRVRMSESRYFKRREHAGDFESYYDPKTDPDGKTRDLLLEKDKKISFFKDEIAFINALPSSRTQCRKVLDVGCGAGFVLSAVDSSWETYGLEVSQKAADLAKKYIQHVHVGPLTADTYPAECFDAVTCLHVIEHVEDPVGFMQNICRILKTHGHLVIATPNFDSGAARRFQEKFRLLHDQTHISLFGDWGLRLLLEDCGFIVDRVDYPFFDTEYFTRENLLRLFDVSRMSPPFYGNIMTMYARKK